MRVACQGVWHSKYCGVCKIFLWRFLDEYDINTIRANIALDMVSGMYDYMALRETNSC